MGLKKVIALAEVNWASLCRDANLAYSIKMGGVLLDLSQFKDSHSGSPSAIANALKPKDVAFSDIKKSDLIIFKNSVIKVTRITVRGDQISIEGKNMDDLAALVKVDGSAKDQFSALRKNIDGHIDFHLSSASMSAKRYHKILNPYICGHLNFEESVCVLM
jgi:hypothetical protein